jgi:hypothetical protein
MTKEWVVRLLQAAAITITIAAVCQELEKPRAERQWCGKVGFVPYDFRFPTPRRFLDAYWNPESSHLFTPEPWGIGWAINFHALVEKLWLVSESCLSEEDFLAPTPSLKRVLEDRPSTV